MGDLEMPLIALAAAYLYAAAAFPLLTGSSWIIASLVAVIPLAGPLLVPSEEIVARALVSFLCVDLTFKMLDLARESRQGRRWTWADYLRMLIPIPVLLVRLRDRRRLREPATWREVPRAILAVTIVTAMFLLLFPMTHVAGLRDSFWLDHAVKLVMFVVLMEAGSHLVQSVERLLGYDTTPAMRSFYLALTPAEFWSRYNTRIHSWLEANVFRPCGGRVRGVVAVFFVSAAFHELMFDMATSHVDGYQFTFFMLQAPAVIASPWLKRFADRYGKLGRAFARGLTITWFYFTSIFFFHGVERVFPIGYASQPWLP